MRKHTTRSRDRRRSQSDFGYRWDDEILRARKRDFRVQGHVMWSKWIFKQLNNNLSIFHQCTFPVFTQTFLMLLSPHWWFVVWPWEHVLITTLLRPSDLFEISLISQPLVTFFIHRPEKDFIQGRADISHVCSSLNCTGLYSVWPRRSLEGKKKQFNSLCNHD